MTQRVLVAGASGRLGRELVSVLKDRGYYVRALARNASRLSSLCACADERLAVDVLRTKSIRSASATMDIVISCLGASVIPTLRHGRDSFTRIDLVANRMLLTAAEEERVRKFVYFSVFSNGKLLDNDFVRGHEEVVRSLRSSSLDYVVVRSTGFFSSLVHIMRDQSMGLLPQHGAGEAQTNPIHEADLAEYCADAIEKPGRSLEFSVGGPQILTRRYIARLVHGELTGRRAVVRVPIEALSVAGTLIAPANRRVSQLMKFIAGVLSSDFIAPEYGSRTLSQYIAAEASGRTV